MKRKRGCKSGYQSSKNVKMEANSPPVSTNTNNLSVTEADDGQPINERDIGSSALLFDKPMNPLNMVAAVVDKEAKTELLGYSRVRVKLKSSGLKPHHRFSDVQTQSDTDRINQQVTLEMPDTTVSDTAVSEKADNVYMEGKVPVVLAKKTGSIKIKSKGLSYQKDVHETFPEKINVSPMLLDKGLTPSDNEKTMDSLPKSSSRRDFCYNEKELKSALEVIKKVMKMDAAGPFNTPVDPVSLGIPDYFDVIDTPMDFGTIHHDLEKGSKYMNSEDVYKDVQYIWDNCYKYNNKGDYILDLMKRVKKNFMKYWTTSGLYTDPSTSGIHGAMENPQNEGDNKLGVKMHHKIKSKHKRRRYGTEKHKSDCMCAVCIVKRKRKEHQEITGGAKSQIVTSDAECFQAAKLEGRSPLDDASSFEPSLDADADVDEGEARDDMRMASPEQHNAQINKVGILNNEMGLLPNPSGSNMQSPQSPVEDINDETSQQSQGQEMEIDVQEKKQEVYVDAAVVRGKQIQEQETPLQENHSVLQLCRSLFPSTDHKSVWNGLHSLYRRCPPIPSKDNSIGLAVAKFLKQD